MHRPVALASSLLVLLSLVAGVAQAKPVEHTFTATGVDWISSGVGGVGGGSGEIDISGIGEGTVTQAFLYWHGIDNSGAGAVYDNATVTITEAPREPNPNPIEVTGINIGDSTTNCWGSGSSSAYRADVTSIVTGNGDYLIEGLSALAGHSANGASLVVIYDDGNPENDRDLAFFEGNDSDTTGFPGEDLGWNGVLTPIDFSDALGTAAAELHVADGQPGGINDGPVTFSTPNGNATFPDTATLYDGTSVTNSGTGRGNQTLWDIHLLDITAAFGQTAGSVDLDFTGQLTGGDCLGLILLLVDLPLGSAPPPPAEGTIDPELALNAPGTDHTVTVTVTEDNEPVEGREVTFEILSGPNAGDPVAALTDANGQAFFTYTSNGELGVDVIQASFFGSDEQQVILTAEKFWDADCQPNGIPDLCDVHCSSFGACDAWEGCGGSPDFDNNFIPDECLPPDPMIFGPYNPPAPDDGWYEMSAVSEVAAAGELVAGDLVNHVAAGADGLHIFNVTDRENALFLGSWAPSASTCPFGFYFDAVKVYGGLLFVAAGNCGLLILDISDPENPVLAPIWDDNQSLFTRSASSASAPEYAKDVAVAEYEDDNEDLQTYVLVADYWNGVFLFQITGDGAPFLFGLYPLEVMFGSVLVDLGAPLALELAIVDGQSLILAATVEGLIIADPEAESPIIGFLDTNPLNLDVTDPNLLAVPQGLSVLGNFAYLAMWQAGMYVVNLTQPWAPKLRQVLEPAENVETIFETGIATYDTAVAQDGLRIVSADGLCGMSSYDATAVSGIVGFSSFSPITDIGGGSPEDCTVMADGPWLWSVLVLNDVVYAVYGFLDPRDGGLDILLLPPPLVIGCGVGPELVLLLPPLWWLRNRRRARKA